MHYSEGLSSRPSTPVKCASLPFFLLILSVGFPLEAQKQLSAITFDAIPPETTFLGPEISLLGPVKIDTGIPQDLSLRIIEGDVLLDSNFEEAILMRRTDLENMPTFSLGRIVIAGDGSPEFRVIYSDAMTAERSVLEFDNKGIVASVRQPGVPGSHFEGFFAGDSEPVFRLSSFPAMQLELGPGGSSPTDVAIRRVAADTIGFLTGGAERVRIDGQGYLRLEVSSTAPPALDCDEASERGRLKIDSANSTLYVCVDSGWLGLVGPSAPVGGHP